MITATSRLHAIGLGVVWAFFHGFAQTSFANIDVVLDTTVVQNKTADAIGQYDNVNFNNGPYQNDPSNIFILRAEQADLPEQPLIGVKTKGKTLRAPLMFDLSQIKTINGWKIRGYAEWEPKERVVLGLSGAEPDYTPLIDFAKSFKQSFSNPKLELFLDRSYVTADQAQPPFQPLDLKLDFPIRFLKSRLEEIAHRINYPFNRDPFPIPIEVDGKEQHLVLHLISTWDFATYCSEQNNGCPLNTNHTPALVTMPYYMVGGELLTDGQHLCAVGDRLFYKSYQATGTGAFKTASLMKAYFGCEKLIVLKSNSADGTGHIDMIAKFLPKERILLGEISDQNDLAFQQNQANLAFIEFLAQSGFIKKTLIRMPLVKVSCNPLRAAMSTSNIDDRFATSSNQTFKNRLTRLLPNPTPPASNKSKTQVFIACSDLTKENNSPIKKFRDAVFEQYTAYLNSYLVNEESVFVPLFSPGWSEHDPRLAQLNQLALAGR